MASPSLITVLPDCLNVWRKRIHYFHQKQLINHKINTESLTHEEYFAELERKNSIIRERLENIDTEESCWLNE